MSQSKHHNSPYQNRCLLLFARLNYVIKILRNYVTVIHPNQILSNSEFNETITQLNTVETFYLIISKHGSITWFSHVSRSHDPQPFISNSTPWRSIPLVSRFNQASFVNLNWAWTLNSQFQVEILMFYFELCIKKIGFERA